MELRNGVGNLSSKNRAITGLILVWLKELDLRFLTILNTDKIGFVDAHEVGFITVKKTFIKTK